MGDLSSVKAKPVTGGWRYADETEDCQIDLTIAASTIDLKQTGACGFGAGVQADGKYTKK